MGYKVLRIEDNIITGPYYKSYNYEIGKPSENIDLVVLKEPDMFNSVEYFITQGYHFFPDLQYAIKELHEWGNNDELKLFAIEIPAGAKYCYSDSDHSAVASSIIITDEIKV